ncbi:MAG TPA: guanitoxin biosynthesis PLP-dependent transaminase GntE [Anaerolineales bacterium]|nr:guanitoxin biosynthesis PLP-dependent transaminase GntE [Anaerolineales bacterium]
MKLQGEKAKAIFKRALDVFPYGVNSNFRYWGDDDTPIIARGKGAYIWDADDQRYIDYRLAFGPIILGHAEETVVNYVAEVIKDGTLYAFTSPHEVDAGERIKRLTGVDKIRLTNTGTEATMHAIRIARAYTGREKILKFEGQYHGVHDYVLFSTANSPIDKMGSRDNPTPVQVSTGIPAVIKDLLIVVPYNDVERIEEAVEKNWRETAAIIVEPSLGNVAGITPMPGFLEKLRELCDKYGIVLIFDEVKTGFRLANGGAQEYFNIRADLVTYAKSLGNGFPVAAIAGKEAVMMTIDPGKMIHTGTYNGNVIGAAAAVATLDILEREPVIARVHAAGRRLRDGIDEILTRRGVPHVMTGLPPMFGYALGTEIPPRDVRDYEEQDAELYEKISMAMIERGVMPETDGKEPWFMCAAHTDEIIDETLGVFDEAVKVSL